MTPTSIRTGRQLDSRVFALALPDATITPVVLGDANRVGLVVALDCASVAAIGTNGLAIGPVIQGNVIPLTTLTLGHPVCYLSVDKIGSAVMLPISALSEAGSAIVLGVTVIRQVQELP